MLTNSDIVHDALSIAANIRERIVAEMARGKRLSGFYLAGEIAQSQPAFDIAASPNLSNLQSKAQSCYECPLGQTRRKLVFGEGNPRARLVFIGEAPGADEDEQGRPFVGRAGQLLTKIIEAMKLKRDDVYICNILKCRPPGNRTPLPEEISRCLPLLNAQLAAIAPQIICTLGSISTQAILQTLAPISVLRGKFHDYQGMKVMPTFHPAYLLRNPQAKKSVWSDMQLIMQELS